MAAIGNCHRRPGELEISAIPDVDLDLPRVCKPQLAISRHRVEPALKISKDASFSKVSPDPHMIMTSNSAGAGRALKTPRFAYRASRLLTAPRGVCEGNDLSQWRMTPSKPRPVLPSTSVDV